MKTLTHLSIIIYIGLLGSLSSFKLSKNITTHSCIQAFKSENVDTPSLIKNVLIRELLKNKINMITDNRTKMQGIKLGFNILKYWVEQKTDNKRMAYYFTNKEVNTSLQIVISEPSGEREINSTIINSLLNMAPGLTSKMTTTVSGEKAIVFTNDYSKTLNVGECFLNTMTVAFIHKTCLVIFTFNNAKFNTSETKSNINDFYILYSTLAKSIKILK